MRDLEVAMKKHNIDIDSSSSTSSSHGHAFFASGFSFNATSISSSDEWIIDYGAYCHMDKDKAIFSTLNECNSKKIFVGDDRFLSVVGSRIVQVVLTGKNDPFNQTRDNARWKVPIRPTLVSDSFSDHILAWLPI
jgi:hypothetical protein